MIIRDPVTPALAEFARKLSGPARQTLNAAAGARLFALIQKHFSRYAATHHKSAARLGAKPTGHLEEAAQAMIYHATPEEASVEVSAAGLQRAFRAFVVRPRLRRALTIPMHPAAYGVRVAELRRTVPALFRPKGKDFLMGYLPGAQSPVLLYLLRGAVRIPHDPRIFPAEKQRRAAVLRGYQAALRDIWRRRQAGAKTHS